MTNRLVNIVMCAGSAAINWAQAEAGSRFVEISNSGSVMMDDIRRYRTLARYGEQY